MSRMASPAEKVSFAVTMGTILIPEVGLDHLDSLCDKEDSSTFCSVDGSAYRIAALTTCAYDRHTTKTSCTPASARLSNVQSNKGALQIGSRHWRGWDVRTGFQT